MYNCLKTNVTGARPELKSSSEKAKFFFLPAAAPKNQRSRQLTDVEEPQNRTQRRIGAVAALVSCKGFILGEPIKDEKCKALSIFNRCDSTEFAE